MKPELYTRVFVDYDVPDEGLKQGNVATVVEYVEHPEGGEVGAILEVFNAVGETLGIATVPVSPIEPLGPNLIPSVRTIEMDHFQIQ